ncbi:hypothetical protein N7535_008182 [Penicillium sp. DV-2018c]|nr:hypothetical protein N7535_008182 [Penicillium sp. DV-2018c]
MDNYTPVSPQSNVFRPRRSDDWHEYREIIEQLYRNDQLKLRDVKRIMERDYKFFASEKQYKDRLAAWHVRKNIKAKEVHLMLRKQQKRAAQGKQTAFRVNGQNVDPKRIARFVRRYGTSWDTKPDKEPETEPQSPEPQTPSDMTCYTPEPADEQSVTTPISPIPDMHSPREMPPFPLGSYGKSPVLPAVRVRTHHIDPRYPNLDPNHLENLPDLELDESPMPMTMHSTQPRHIHSYHHSIGNHLAQAHPHPHSHSQPNHHVAHPHPHAHAHAHGHGHGPAVHAQPGPAPRDLEDAPGEDDTHPPDWNTVESFQTRLQGLDYTLTHTMSKWARDDHPHSEIPHHEGLGM